MNVFIRLATGECPLYEGDVRLTNPEIPEHLTGETFPTPNGYAKIETTPPPVYDINTQVLGRFEAENINGTWRQKWTIIDLTPEQIDFFAKQRAEYEAQRQAMLAEELVEQEDIDVNVTPITLDLTATDVKPESTVNTLNP